MKIGGGEGECCSKQQCSSFLLQRQNRPRERSAYWSSRERKSVTSGEVRENVCSDGVSFIIKKLRGSPIASVYVPAERRRWVVMKDRNLLPLEVKEKNEVPAYFNSADLYNCKPPSPSDWILRKQGLTAQTASKIPSPRNTVWLALFVTALYLSSSWLQKIQVLSTIFCTHIYQERTDTRHTR